MADIAAQFAEHLAELLDFHRDDAASGQGQFAPSPVETAHVLDINESQLFVTLQDGRQIIVTVAIEE